MAICKVCGGVGYHVSQNRTNYRSYKTDNWGVKYFLGERYRYKICKSCMGTGDTDDLIIKLAPWELEDEMLSYALPNEEIEHKKHNDHKELLLIDIVKIKVKT
jgi:hypothetical protein